MVDQLISWPVGKSAAKPRGGQAGKVTRGQGRGEAARGHVGDTPRTRGMVGTRAGGRTLEARRLGGPGEARFSLGVTLILMR